MKTRINFRVLISILLPLQICGLVISFSGPATTTISEDETHEKQLTLITITGVTAGQTASCDLDPTEAQFWVKLDPTSGKYGVYLVGNANLDFNVKSMYTLNVKCTDSVSTVQESYIVNIDKNDSPTLSNLHNYTSIDTSTTTTGTLVFMVSASDPESDQLTFAMECYVLNLQQTCPFQIFDSGQILTTSDFSTYTVSTYDLRVTVTDDHNNQVGPYSLSVTVTGLNTAPVIDSTNLPYTTVVLENTPGGTSIYQVSVTDPDVGDIHTYSATFTPSEASNYFSIDSSTGLISTSTTSNIDYDTLSFTSCTLDITVSDKYATDSGTLTINIANVNEAPQFAKSMYSLRGSENSAGTSFGTPNYGVTDEDVDSTTFGTDCIYFNVDSSSGEVTLSVNYDLDDITFASTVTCGVTVTDGTLTSTATLQIFITNSNDNVPQFTQNSYSFHVSPYSPIGTIIDSVTATDADTDSYGVVSYRIESGSYSDYFGIDQSGRLYVKANTSDTISGQTVSVTVTAYDKGNRKDTVDVSFVVQATTTVTTTTTTDRTLNFFETPENIAWFSALMVLLAGLLGYLGMEMYRSQMFFKVCSASCNECHLPKRRKFDLHEDDDDFDDETMSPSPPPSLTPVNTGSPDLGWSPWNDSSKQGNFF